MTDTAPNDSTPRAANGSAPPTLWGKHTFISMGITLAILVGLTFFVDLNQIWQEVKTCKKGFVLLGALAHYATYPVRGIRWRRHVNG